MDTIQEDLYDLLGIEYTATKKEIGFAYRTKSLTCHPDKVGADDAQAVDQFIKLTKAYEILRDPVQKRVYDERYKAKIAHKQKMSDMDIKRRKATIDLNEREEAAKRFKEDAARDAVYLNAEIERLRAEGFKLMKEREAKQEKARLDLENSIRHVQADQPEGLDATLTVKWKKSVCDYSETQIKAIFKSLGAEQVIVSMKRDSNRGTALIEFGSILRANNVLLSRKSQNQELLNFEINWASGAPPINLPRLQSTTTRTHTQTRTLNGESESSKVPSMDLSFEEYESATLARMMEQHHEIKS